MIDEAERTPVIFILLNDEHRSQILSNILQVKERGATTLIITNVDGIEKLIDLVKIDFLIQLPPIKNQEVFAALQAVVPLQMICYQSAIKRGLDPDQQILKAIDFASELD